ELRAQSGEARYEIYRKSSGTLAHRFEVMVKPGQATRQLEATLRHELGHALGLWGHSRNPEDALYYSQVSAPPAVSQRDVATLCQVYQQPTALGWPQVNSGP
ncbi:MAG: peptidase, partial [Cyanobacteria bacterium P01_A01_bin.135]